MLLDREVSQRVKDRRRAMGLTQDELSRRAGISRRMLSGVENGERGMGAEILSCIAKAMQVSMEWVLEGGVAPELPALIPKPEEKEDRPAPCIIPAALVAYAQKEGLSFRQTLYLSRVAFACLGDKIDSLDWLELREALGDFMPE